MTLTVLHFLKSVDKLISNFSWTNCNFGGGLLMDVKNVDVTCSEPLCSNTTAHSLMPLCSNTTAHSLMPLCSHGGVAFLFGSPLNLLELHLLFHGSPSLCTKHSSWGESPAECCYGFRRLTRKNPWKESREFEDFAYIKWFIHSNFF